MNILRVTEAVPSPPFTLEMPRGLVFLDRAVLPAAMSCRSFRSLSAALQFDPSPQTRCGFATRISHALGGSASGGVEALLGPDTFPTLADRGQTDQDGTWNLEAAYGLPARRGLVASPYMRLTNRAGGEARFGYRLEPGHVGQQNFNLDVWLEPGPPALSPPTPEDTPLHTFGYTSGLMPLHTSGQTPDPEEASQTPARASFNLGFGMRWSW